MSPIYKRPTPVGAPLGVAAYSFHRKNCQGCLRQPPTRFFGHYLGLLSRCDQQHFDLATMRAAEPDLVASSNERKPKRHDIEDRKVAGRGCVGVRAEREKTAQSARNQLVAEFNGSADRLAREILRLRVAMGHVAQAATMAREGREFSFLRAKPVGPQERS
jgi:hypothetical protein